MAGFKRWLASGTVIDPLTTSINFDSLTATKDGDTTTLTQSGAESVTIQTATTKVLTPIVDTIAAGSLSVGPTTATSVLVGSASVATTPVGGLSIPANKNIVCLAGTTAVDLSLGTGAFTSPSGTNTLSGNVAISGSKTFTTGTGAVSLAGATTLAANINLACASGTTAVDLSLGTGTFKTPTGIHTFGGKLAAGATVNVIADPGNAGAIAVTTSGVCNLTSGGAETRTLAIPTFVGQQISLCCDVYVGDIVITVASAFNQATNTTITLNTAGDCVNLIGAHIAGARRWRIINNDGATLG